MRGFESREPGVVGAVFDHPSVRASIIADSYHCNPTAIRIAYRLLGERLFLISDALFANPPRPTFELGQFVVHFEPDTNGPGLEGPGRYVNNEANLAGSAITLIDCVKIAVEQAGIPLIKCVANGFGDSGRNYRYGRSTRKNSAGLRSESGTYQYVITHKGRMGIRSENSVNRTFV
jgi:N-acetylglucosamine-6-phosphate deacetylase